MDMASKKGKTKTIKERAIYVYLPSIEMARVWKLRADTAGLSTSKFGVNRIEDSISREEHKWLVHIGALSHALSIVLVA